MKVRNAAVIASKESTAGKSSLMFFPVRIAELTEANKQINLFTTITSCVVPLLNAFVIKAQRR
jgi:hypothetical protein